MTNEKFYKQHEIPTGMTDEKLYELCKKYGEIALSARRKFAGLLPEVYRRRLYEKKNFSSIFEFAAKLAGMSKDQVSLVLNLEKKFLDKSVLRGALVSGEISANKLTRVASIATVENQEELFEKTRILSNRAIEVFVRDAKSEMAKSGSVNEGLIKIENYADFSKPLFDTESLHVQTLKSDLKLDTDVENELFEMQEKGIDINQFLREALRERKEKIQKKKDEIAKRCISGKQGEIEDKKKEMAKRFVGNEMSRYIPAAVRRVIREEHGTKCSYPGCSRQAQVLHHTQRFSMVERHDPHFIAPLCQAHHEIAHKIDVRFAEKSG